MSDDSLKEAAETTRRKKFRYAAKVNLKPLIKDLSKLFDNADKKPVIEVTVAQDKPEEPEKIIRRAFATQRSMVEKYILFMKEYANGHTTVTRSQLFAYFVEQINIADKLYAQFFEHVGNTTYINRYPENVTYLTNAFPIPLSRKQRMSESIVNMDKTDYDSASTKYHKFDNIKEIISGCGKLATQCVQIGNTELYLVLEDYNNALIKLINVFTATINEKSSPEQSTHYAPSPKKDKYLLEDWKNDEHCTGITCR